MKEALAEVGDFNIGRKIINPTSGFFPYLLMLPQ
jgi:hypothetical protein